MTLFGETFFKASSAEMNAASQAEPAQRAPFSSVLPPVHPFSTSSSPVSSLLTPSVSNQAIDRLMMRKKIAEEVLETSLVAGDPSESLLDCLTCSASEKSRRLLKTREMTRQNSSITRNVCEEIESNIRSIYTAFESLQQVDDSAEKFFRDQSRLEKGQSDKINSRTECRENGQSALPLSGISQTVIDLEISNRPAHTRDKPAPKRSPFLFPIHWPKCCNQLRESAPIQIKQLVDHLLHQVQSGKRRIAFCGNHSGCGCTTLLLCTARELAAYGQKTIVIDANFENPDVASSLQLPIAQGWEQLLQKNTEWSNKMIELQYVVEPNLTILPLSKTIFSAAHSLQQVEAILDGVCRPYDFALMDAGCLSGETEKMERKIIELARFAVDGVLLIVGKKSTSEHNRSLLQESLLQESLQSYGIVQIGIAENGV